YAPTSQPCTCPLSASTMPLPLLPVTTQFLTRLAEPTWMPPPPVVFVTATFRIWLWLLASRLMPKSKLFDTPPAGLPLFLTVVNERPSPPSEIPLHEPDTVWPLRSRVMPSAATR